MNIFNLSELLSDIIFFALHIGDYSSFPKALSKKEEARLLEGLKNKDTKARQKLIEHNLRLVAHIIKKYYSAYSDQEDLISIGTIGLIKAVNSFSPDKGTRLSTYAARCIENEVLMYFRMIKKTAQEVSINEPIDADNEGNPLTISDMIFCEDTIVEDLSQKNDLQKLKGFVKEIKNPRDKAVIIMRYGLDGNDALTQKQVAEKLNISRSYVSRIEKKVLNQLREKFK